MTFIIKLIKRLFPDKIITHRLVDLTELTLNENNKNAYTCISIENDNNSRQFCYLTIDELATLYEKTCVNDRSLYEVIFPTNETKAYIDFEYYNDNNIDICNRNVGPTCCLKMLYGVLNFDKSIIDKSNHNIDVILQQFLVLDASISKKTSFHFIHANPCVIFENNSTLGFFINIIIHFFLYSVAQHKCSSFNINIDPQRYTMNELVIILTPYIDSLRKCCTNCNLHNSCISVAEVAHLLVRNSDSQVTTAVDMKVYSKNQQFRLFNCVKKNQMNPLVVSNRLPFDNDREFSLTKMLKKSIVTCIEQSNLPIIYLKDDQFLCKNIEKTEIFEKYDNRVLNLNFVNQHIKNFYMCNLKCKSNAQYCNSINNFKTTYINNDHNEKVQLFMPFVTKLITQDKNHTGYIRSCIQGTTNKDILFFNIGGQYRYCDKKGGHHQRNTTAILIDSKNLTYSIRCKDANCDNTCLIWKKIE